MSVKRKEKKNMTKTAIEIIFAAVALIYADWGFKHL